MARPVVIILVFTALLWSCGDGDDDVTPLATPAETVADRSRTTATQPTGTETSGSRTTEPQVDGTDNVWTTTAPGDWCPVNEEPSVAAYDVADGDVRWVACTPAEPVRRSILDVSAEVVWLELIARSGTQRVIGLAVDDGSERSDLPDAPPPTAPPDREVAGVRIVGAQEGPTSGVDAKSGETLWTRPGSSVYDDVTAVGDGAVYVSILDPAGSKIIAYEVRTGDTRWEFDLGSAPDAWPWHVEDGLLFSIWNDIVVVSTDDGSMVWRSDYPFAAFPRMTAVDVAGDTAFVAFSSVASGGD